MPQYIRPLLRAYSLGYVSFVSPRLLHILLSRANKSKSEAFIIETLRKAFELNRFPAFCGITVGGWRLLLPVTKTVVKQICSLPSYSKNFSATTHKLIANFFASFISGAVGLQLLNGGYPEAPAGRTLDLTLWTATRALDVLVGELWLRRKKRRLESGNWSRFEDGIGKLADAMAFSLTAGIVMFAWFYIPEQLPRAYNQWITGMSNLDSRLIVALRRIRGGEFIYGEDTGQADLLGPYCKMMGLLEVLGDPQRTVPIPCRLIHSGWTDNCEKHAVWRFWSSWTKAFVMYFPLNLVTRLRRPSLKSLSQALLQSARSSAFLGAFVAIFYYSVCLTRTRLGPRFFPNLSPMFWDNGLIVKMGCTLCGWSVLIESPARRAEMSAFVAPKALGVVLPRKYSRKHQWREVLAFALSFAVVMTAFHANKARVRGVTGRVLGRIVA
ncbi:hypothetical protein L211DRAFT_855676 [Terfezia boudieri ATCC MYA-4762]|uniref:Integral membrane protein n=1 Tax=Terfezia boudieri ATCC MYA-4762 TaxID=1051890 RepID=A0A3N4M259_9PEZI|nr:hypothetical protein L211DRAFT_855676 [Terfezia boudieri ATCC MYA-4762]